jgi:hypothetical protein
MKVHTFFYFIFLIFCTTAFCYSEDLSPKQISSDLSNSISESKVAEYANKEDNSNDNKKSSTDFHFSFSPLFDFKYGTIREYVFLNNCTYSNDKLSELDWDLKPMVQLGVNANGGWKGILLSGYIEGAVPNRSGTMADSDWFNVKTSDLANYQYKTHYSESDNYVDSCMNCGVRLGYNFTLPFSIELYPFGAFDYEYINFMSKDGTNWYGLPTTSGGHTYYSPYTDESNRTSETMDGKNVGYTRYSYFTWIGLQAAYTLKNKFKFDASFQTAPYVYCQSMDEHYLTGSTYIDVTSGTFCAFKYATSASYIFNKRYSLNLAVSYFTLNTIRGNSYQKYGSSYVRLTSTDGGADENYFCASIYLKASLL